MATSKENHERLLESLEHLQDITTRAMMGEYLLYYRGVLIGGIYDNQLLLKETPGTAKYQLERIVPYNGAKRTMYLVSDLENQQKLTKIISTTYEELAKK